MLCVNKYKKDYVAACRKKMEAQLRAYGALPKSAAREAFEPLFLNNLVLEVGTEAPDRFADPPERERFRSPLQGLLRGDGSPLRLRHAPAFSWPA